MRLCIPTTDDSGLRSRLSPHFGSAPYFTIVDTETNEGTVIVNDHAKHEHGRCDPVRSIADQSIDAAICRGLGRRALERLRGHGVSVMVTEAWTVSAALEAYRTGKLRPMQPDEACAGHRHQPRGLHGPH
jgi:predicted Fe-Mo cluster-binding NifX family protein